MNWFDLGSTQHFQLHNFEKTKSTTLIKYWKSILKIFDQYLKVIILVFQYDFNIKPPWNKINLPKKRKGLRYQYQYQ